MKRTCPGEHEIAAFVAGDLDAQRRSEALEHVDGCESCRALVAVLAQDADVAGEAGISSDHSCREQDEVEVGPGVLVDGRFRLAAPLGRGAMSTVHRARDEKLGIDVALKVIHAHGSERDERAFARELVVGRRVTHPNVCRLHDAGRHGELSYITMELVDGETLAELLSREPPPRERSLEILVGLASGLAAAHRQAIVHRDLKPANVMIEGGSGRAVITDFGFAADLESTQSRRLVGTPQYWAPEQARGEPATPASDVYSFGLIAYRLLAGRAYSLSDPGALAAVPRSYRGFLARCLEARPSARFRDAGDVLEALQRAERGRRWIGWAAAAVAFVIAFAVVRQAGHRSSEGAASTVGSVSSTETSTHAPGPASAAPRGDVAGETSSRPVPSVAEKPIVSATNTRPVHPPRAAASTTTSRGASPAASVSAAPEDPLYRH